MESTHETVAISPMTDRQDKGLRDARVVAAIWLGVIAPQSVWLLPIIVGSLVDRFQLGPAGAGVVASATLIGACVVSLLQAVALRATSLRRLATVFVACLCLAFIALATRPVLSVAVAALFAAGVGTGGLLVIAHLILAASRVQTQGIGLLLGIQGALGAGLAYANSLITSQYGELGLFVLMLAASLAAVPALKAVPDGPAEPSQASAVRRSGSPASFKALFVALVAWGAINFANGGFWPLIEVIAKADGHSARTVSEAIALASMFAVAGGFAASALGRKLGDWLAIVLTGLATAAAVIGISAHPSEPMLFASLALFGFLWNFGPPYQIPVIARADPAACGMPLAIGSMKIFMAIAPICYGLVAERAGYAPVGILAGVVAVVSTGLFVLALRMERRLSPTAAQIAIRS